MIKQQGQGWPWCKCLQMAGKNKEGRGHVLSGLLREDSWKGPEQSFGVQEVKVSRGEVEEQPSRASRHLELKPKLRALAGILTSWSGCKEFL